MLIKAAKVIDAVEVGVQIVDGMKVKLFRVNHGIIAAVTAKNR